MSPTSTGGWGIMEEEARRMSRWTFAMMAMGASGAAWAQEVVVHVDPELAAQTGVDSAEVERQIKAASGGQFKLDAPRTFLEQTAAANAFATKGMGVDYASNPQRFVVGGSFGSAVQGAGLTFVRGKESLPEAGFALQAAVMAGLNLGFLSPDESLLRRFVVSVNGMYVGGKTGPFEADLYNLGGHLQIKLIRPPHEGVVEWGGLDVTTGYELSSYALHLSQALSVDAEGLRWDADGNFDVVSKSETIPIELSTNVRVLVLSAYVGIAGDLRRSAYATGDISLAGPLWFTGGGQEQEIGTVDATLGTRGEALGFVPRGFVGAQINILPVKLYGHLNLGLDDTYGGHVGLRVAL